MSKTKNNSLSSSNNQIVRGYINDTQFFNQGMPSQGYGIPTTTTSDSFTITQNNQSVELASANARQQPVFFQWVSLMKIYTSEWLAKKAVDIPVEDAFRNWKFGAESGLDDYQIKEIDYYCRTNNVFTNAIEVNKLARVFGGGAILALDKYGDNEKPIKKGDSVNWTAVDLWQLNRINTNKKEDYPYIDVDDSIFYYNQSEISPSRCVAVKSGITPPNYFKSITRGWDLSVFDTIINPLNTCNRFFNTIFEAAKECYIDVLAVSNLEDIMMNQHSADTMMRQLQKLNYAKSVYGMMVIDKENEFNRKNIDFAGIVSAWTSIKQIIAGGFNLPIEKLFQESAKGMNNGGDITLEIYNVYLEGLKIKYSSDLIKTLKMVCIVLYGYVPEGLWVKFENPRILTPTEEIAKKEQQLRALDFLYMQGVNRRHLLEKFNECQFFDSELPQEAFDDLEDLPSLPKNEKE